MHWVMKRMARSLLTIFVVFHIGFLLYHSLPGGPKDYLRSTLNPLQGGERDAQLLNRLSRMHFGFNPDAPLHEQYLDYMASLLSGDFGVSIWYQEPVTQLMIDALPWTMFYVSVSVFFSWSIGLVVGAVMAYMEQSKFDISVTLYSVLSNSVPYYIIAIVMLWVLGYNFNLFPLRGKYDPATTPGFNIPFLLGAIHHASLPILSFVLTGFGGIALGMRANSIRVLGEDYLRVARLRGLPTSKIATEYVGRNAILPLYTGFMIGLARFFSGSVILETIFVYRGTGFYIFRGIESRDYPLLLGGFILLTLVTIIGILLAELTYGKIDPRAREGGEQHEAY